MFTEVYKVSGLVLLSHKAASERDLQGYKNALYEYLKLEISIISTSGHELYGPRHVLKKKNIVLLSN